MSDIIRLLEGETVIDSVACDYEDSFCLETFGDLCEQHRNVEPKGKKAFIIARVQTWDPKQPDKAFYSYYNAFHLNKILFQTQNYLGKRFIHRLHVLNPLTNSDIIGNVQYFMIKPPSSTSEKETTIIEIPLSNPDEPSHPVTSPSGQLSQSLNGQFMISNPDEPMSPSHQIEIVVQPPPNRRRSSIRLRMDSGNQPSGMMMPATAPSTNSSPTRRMSDFTSRLGPRLSISGNAGNPHDPKSATTAWTMANHTVSEAPDEEDPSKLNQSGNRRRPSLLLEISRSMAYMKRRMPMAPTMTTSPNSKQAKQANPAEPIRQRSMSLVVSRPEVILTSAVKNRRRSEFTIPALTSKTPESPVRAHQMNKAPAPPGIITRFTVPVPREELANLVPKTYKGHRRSLSYANAVSASGSPASFEEWVKMVQQEKGSLKDKQLKETGDEYDVVKPFAQTPKTPVSFELSLSGRAGMKLGTIVDECTASPGEEGNTLSPNSIKSGKNGGESDVIPKSPVIASSAMAASQSGVFNDSAAREAAQTAFNANAGKQQAMDQAGQNKDKAEADDEDDASALEVRVYDAVLFATDNDFLESSKIRAVFRENAVAPEDAKLFEMPAYNGQEAASPTVEIVDDSLICEWCYPSPQTLARSTPFMRGFHRIKCYLFAALLASMVFVFILIIVLQGTKTAHSS